MYRSSKKDTQLSPKINEFCTVCSRKQGSKCWPPRVIWKSSRNQSSPFVSVHYKAAVFVVNLSLFVGNLCALTQTDAGVLTENHYENKNARHNDRKLTEETQLRESALASTRNSGTCNEQTCNVETCTCCRNSGRWKEKRTAFVAQNSKHFSSARVVLVHEQSVLFLTYSARSNERHSPWKSQMCLVPSAAFCRDRTHKIAQCVYASGLSKKIPQQLKTKKYTLLHFPHQLL